MRVKSISLLIILCIIGSGAQAQTSTKPLLIRDVRVFDGERVLEHRSVLVENGRISRIGGAHMKDSRAEVVDGRLESYVKLGRTPTQALASSTSVPAHYFHLTDRGFIRRGMRADLVLVEGDPTKDILATRNIVAVFKKGVRVQR